MKSLFRRLYDVLARSTVHQREDYLTEILAECLECEAIAEQVLQCILEDRDLRVSESEPRTQRTFRSPSDKGSYDRPDVTWKLETEDDRKWLVFIECKLKAPESGADQLGRYARRLADLTDDTEQESLLVYLTERAEPMNAAKYEAYGICFEQTRWYRLHEVLEATEAGPDWLREALVDYLKEEDLDMSRMFRPEDLYALRRSSAVFAIIDEALDGKAAKYAEEELGVDVQQPSSRSTEVQKRDRYVCGMKIDSYKYGILLGVSWQDRPFRDERLLPVATMILQCSPNYEDLDAVVDEMDEIRQRDDEFTDEVPESPNGWRFIERYRPLVDFLSGDDHVAALEDWWLTGLEELVAVAEEGDAPYLDRHRPTM